MRLFFAVWPTDVAALRLRALSEAIAGETGGRATPPANIHLTLEFLGEVAEDRLPILDGIARSIAAKPFRLRLDRLGAFRRARIAWIGAQKPPAGLIELQRALSSGLRGAGFALEERPYSPHVTLARHTAKPAPKGPIEPIEWRVASFSLVRSRPGKAEYADVARWPLD